VQLFDTHCHLHDRQLLEHIDAVLQRAAAAGVRRILGCGCDEASWSANRDLAARFPAVVPAFGLHPLDIARRSPDWLAALRALLLDTGAAVGEIGLDHFVEPRDDADQEVVFEAQLRLAGELNRPVSIHCRRAWGRMIELLSAVGAPAAGIVFHSFSGAPELIESLGRHNAYFSFSGSITRTHNKRGRAAAQTVPWDRLLVETDAPDLMPLRDPGGYGPSVHGSVNEPANLPCVVHTLAHLRGVAPADVAERTWNNACRLFGEKGTADAR
jgi:TatD DNase family protein